MNEGWTVWIDNPPVNVITAAVARRSAQLSRLDAGTRVVVLRGRGEKAFSAGADLTASGSTAARRPACSRSPT